MRNGPCPECNSTEVYYGQARKSAGGLNSSISAKVFIPSRDGRLILDTYICLVCGYVRLYLDEESRGLAAQQLPNDTAWVKVS